MRNVTWEEHLIALQQQSGIALVKKQTGTKKLATLQKLKRTFRISTNSIAAAAAAAAVVVKGKKLQDTPGSARAPQNLA